MNEEVSGIILKQSDYKEADSILTVLTKEYGKISFVARGTKKMTSHNRSAVFPYTVGLFAFDYRQNKTMFSLKTARTQKFYRQLHENIERAAAASLLADMADAMTMERNDCRKEYSLLEKAYDLLNDGAHIHTVCSLFLVEMMDLFGILPEADGCVKCGNHIVYTISAKDGGFLCKKCAPAFSQGKDPADLKRFRLLIKAGLEHVKIVEDAGGAKKSDLHLLIDILEEHGGIHLRSFDFYDRLFAIE